MRVRPDGIELLQAARVAIDAAITPHLADDRRDVLRAIVRMMALAEDRLTQDVEASAADLAALDTARAAMRGEVLEALPDDRRYDARLVAKAIAVATRQLANGHALERREYERLAALLGVPGAAEASPGDIRCALPALNERLATRIRAGEADLGTSSYDATLAHLEAITKEALSESNPAYPRRSSGPEPQGAGALPYAALPVPPVTAAFAAWSDVPSAFLRAFRIGVVPAPPAHRVRAWLDLNGAVGEAVCASSNAALMTQADLFGWFAHRLAGNPRVPMVAVESAHQVHDVFLAIADASAELCRFALASLRGVEPPASDAARVP